MAKLSQQILARQPPQRFTRTQREVYRFTQERLAREQFEKLKAEAEEIQRTEFSNIQSIDDYESRYNKLSPQIQQFFQSPQELREQQRQRIEENKIKTQQEIEYAQNQLSKIVAENIKGDEPQKKYWSEYIQGLQEGLGMLNQGQDVSFSSIESYASSKGESARRIREAKQKQKKASQEAYAKLLETPFAPQFKKLEEQYGAGKIDWTQQANISAGYKQGYVDSYGDFIGRDIAQGNLSSTFVQAYRKAVGEKQFELTKKDIDKQIKLQQNEAIAKYEQEKLSREPFLDVESVEAPKPKWYEKIAMTTKDILYYPFKKVKNLPIPIFTAGAGTSSISLGTATGEASKVVVKGAGYVINETIVGDIKIPVTVGLTGTSWVKMKDITTPMKEFIPEKTQEIKLKQLEKLGITQEYSPIFEAENQARFEDKYSSKLIRGEITFDEAQKEYAESEEAKLVQERYGQVIEKKTRGRITSETWALTGLSLASVGVKLIPETYGELALESAIVYTYVQGLPTLVPKETLGAVGKYYPYVTGTMGTLDLLDPRLSGERRLIGGVMAVGSAGILGYRLAKYLKTTTLKEIEIKSLKSIKADTIVYRDGNLYQVTSGGKTKLIDTSEFAYQKTARIGYAGRRTVVSTKWRDITQSVLNKFNAKMDLSIYRGVPTQQLGKTYYAESFRTSFIYNTKSGYQKALELLSKSDKAFYTNLYGETKLVSLEGLSKGQLKNILRYYAPRVYDITLKSGEIKIVDSIAKGNFKAIIEQPVINLDERLGIKTRGGRTVIKDIDIDRNIVKTVKSGEVEILTNIKERTAFLTKEGGEYNVLKQAGKTTTQSVERSLVKVGDMQDAFRKITIKLNKRIGKNVLGININYKDPYRFQEITGRYARQQTVPYKDKYLIGKQKTTGLSKIQEREIIEIDLDKMQGISFRSKNFMTPAKIKKTPLSKTFGTNNIEEIKEIIKKNVLENKNIAKPSFTFDYADDTSKAVQGQIFKDSQYAGKGVYERTESVGGLTALDKQQLQLNKVLKMGIEPSLDVNVQIKNIILSNQKIVQGFNLGLLTAGALKISNMEKQDLKSSFGLKEDTMLKEDLKSALGLKQSLKEAQAMKQAQAQMLKLDTSLISGFRPPTPPKISIEFEPPPFKIPPFYFGFPEGLKEKVKKKSESKAIRELLYIPDFTARALGLEADILSEKQASARLKKILTGFEIRKGVKIKSNNLLKGIPA